MTERKKTRRKYRIDTFKDYQAKKVKGQGQAIHDILVRLGKSDIKFRTFTELAAHVSRQLEADGSPCSVSALLRKKHTKDGAKVPNPYRDLLLKYEMGKYFGAGKGRDITAEDVEQIRKKFPAVDAYCSMKEGEAKNLAEEVKLLAKEVRYLQGLEGDKALLPADSVSGELSDQLDKTVTALKQLLDVASDFFEVDWERRTIVDLSYRPPKVIIEPDLLTTFLGALENSGMMPPGEI